MIKCLYEWAQAVLLVMLVMPVVFWFQVYKEGRAEPEFKKIDALHQRCLNAERLKEDISLTLQSTQNKLKKMEME